MAQLADDLGGSDLLSGDLGILTGEELESNYLTVILFGFPNAAGGSSSPQTTQAKAWINLFPNP
jgi:hypothetical protein